MSRVAHRQEQKRRQILDSARQLLQSRGWHSVAIDDIGEAAGMTGPAIYRYFENKAALLTAAMSYAAEQLWSSVPEGDDAGLAAHVAGHVDFALENADLVELWYSESQNLAPEMLRAQRRLQRRYMERWVAALGPNAPMSPPRRPGSWSGRPSASSTPSPTAPANPSIGARTGIGSESA